MKKSIFLTLACGMRGCAIQGMRSGRTVLPSSVEVMVKPFAVLPARAKGTAIVAVNAARRIVLRARTVMLGSFRMWRWPADGRAALLQRCGNRVAVVLR